MTHRRPRYSHPFDWQPYFPLCGCTGNHDRYCEDTPWPKTGFDFLTEALLRRYPDLPAMTVHRLAMRYWRLAAPSMREKLVNPYALCNILIPKSFIVKETFQLHFPTIFFVLDRWKIEGEVPEEFCKIELDPKIMGATTFMDVLCSELEEAGVWRDSVVQAAKEMAQTLPPFV